ncbi:unnamed protein product, partial [Candidula unifasciata]
MENSLKIIVVSFITFYLSALIRVAVQLLPFPVPHNFFLVLLGMAFGYLDSYYPEIGFRVLTESNPHIVMHMIIPVIMFEASCFTNLESFVIAGAQVTILVFLNFLFSIGVIGLIVIVVFDYGWRWNHAILLTSIIVAPGPVVTMAFLKRLIASLKLQYFLESEAIMGNCVAVIIFKLCILWSVSSTHYLQEYTMGLCVSPLFGFIIAKAIAYWMSRIIKDSVNQVCIVIASLYACYLVAEISRMSGVIAIVFMGMFMTGRRSNLSENTEKILLRFLHVMSSYFNCNVIMLCGMKLSVILPLLTWTDCANIMEIFILLNLIRVVVVAMLYPQLKNKGYCLSLNSLLVVAVCNIRGVVTILLTFCLLQENFRIHNEVKMFSLALSQVVLSLLFNSTIANGVLRYDVFDEFKSQVIANTHVMLRDTQLDSIFIFKHNNKYLADADWSFVEKFTRIQHPLLTTTFKTEKNKTIERQAINRILMMMKGSYWKQYGEGLLSHDAVKQLFHWSFQALARGNTLIFPSKIQSTLTVPKVYQQFRDDMCTKLQDWIRLGRYSRPLQALYTGTFICLHLTDLSFTVLQLSNEIFIRDSYRNFVFFCYNMIFVGSHGILFIVRVARYKKVSVWEYLIVLLVFLGMADLFAMKLLTSASSLTMLLRLIFISTRLFRILRMAEVFPYMLKILLKMCELNISILLAEGFDIARSYIRGRLEVLRLLSHVEYDIPAHILKKFKDVCTEHKVETTKILGYLQMKHPIISASAKTRQAIRIILTKELDVLRQLEEKRMMRHRDGAVLDKVILTRLTKYLNKWITVMPPSYDRIIASVPWIRNDLKLLNFIMQKGEIVKYSSSEYLVIQSCLPGGIYIILHGIAVLRRKVIERTDYYTEQVMDYLTSGSVIGEFSFLTGKPRHKAVICETDILVMYIRSRYLWQYIGGRPGVYRPKLSNLEERMWKVIAIKLAYRVLIAEPDWLCLSQSEILAKLVDGVVVDGKADPQAFAAYIQNSDIVLIY